MGSKEQRLGLTSENTLEGCKCSSSLFGKFGKMLISHFSKIVIYCLNITKALPSSAPVLGQIHFHVVLIMKNSKTTSVYGHNNISKN